MSKRCVKRCSTSLELSDVRSTMRTSGTDGNVSSRTILENSLMSSVEVEGEYYL